MFKEDYIFLNQKLNSKEEALAFASDKALELGLTDDRDGLLKDFLEREKEYSTGLQDGFAIPHAKSNHVKEVAIFYISSDNIISEWETLDDTPVTHLFVLFVPKAHEGNTHLMMISNLATHLLEDDFREAVKKSSDKAQLKEYILKIMKEDDE